MFGSGGADVRFPVTDLEPAFTDGDGTAIPAIARLNRGEEGSLLS